MKMQSAVIIFMGSEKDRSTAKKITSFLRKNFPSVRFEVRALSAHKLAAEVLDAVKEYGESRKNAVFIAVAGRSNSLGPVIAGHSSFPVINCPVLSEKFDFADLLSSLRMPGSVACCTILEPENAALHAVKILALADAELKKKLAEYFSSLKGELREKDFSLKEEFR